MPFIITEVELLDGHEITRHAPGIAHELRIDAWAAACTRAWRSKDWGLGGLMEFVWMRQGGSEIRLYIDEAERSPAPARALAA